MMTVGSLFSGIGGIELGLERTGGFRTIWNCEIEAYPSAVLKKHWPNVPNLGDITKVRWEDVERPDVICGGFPCQDISIAGKGKGIIEGERSGLWREYVRAIKGTQPKWIIIENVPMLVKRGLEQVMSDLRDADYKSLRPLLIPASAVGAPHRRERIFIVAYSNDYGASRFKRQEKQWGRLCAESDYNFIATRSDSFRLLHRQPNVEPTEGREQTFGESQSSIYPADTETKRLPEGQQDKMVSRGKGWLGFAGQTDCFEAFRNIRTIEELTNNPEIPEPLLRGKNNGVPNRLDRIKCLGNAVVPQVAQIVGIMILEEE